MGLNRYETKLGILWLVRAPPKRIFDIHDPIGMKWLFQLRVGLSHLYAHKKNPNFSDTLVMCDVCKLALKISNTFSSTAYVLKELDALPYILY